MHLHNHSQFSIIDGRGLIDDYLKLALEDEQEAFALTDHGSMGGIVDFYLAAKKLHSESGRTVKPIAGMEMYVDAFDLGSAANGQRSYGHLTVLARNEAGYRALIAANNLAHRQFYYRPRISLQQIIEHNFAENWYILSGCMSSPINNFSFAEAEIIVNQLQRHSAGCFLEVMWHPSTDEAFNAKQEIYLERVEALYRATGLPVVITNDCHFAYKHQEDIHTKLLSASHSPSELEFDGNQFHFLPVGDWLDSEDNVNWGLQSIANYIGVPNAVQNAVDLARNCELVIPEADHVNWHVPDITGGHPEERLREVAERALVGKPDEYRERYEYEMGVLRTSPAILNSYLVAHDVVDWCQQREITIAARGSMGGSLVSHLLGISPEDPIKYNLSFSRAVNPARPTIPDFDLDVSSLHRVEVLDYLKERYVGNVPIISYTHYGPKGAFRKVLRMEGMRDQMNMNDLCKELPDGWADGEFAYNPTAHCFQGDTPWFQSLPTDDYKNYVAIYKGLYSSMSVHPSGLLISGAEREIEREIPFQWIASSGTLASAYDMYTLKKIGLFKLDVLGLKTLDQLEFMKKMTGEVCPNDDYDDPEVLAAFGADLLAEIFQMDGYACRSVIREIRGINTFMDIVAANTLARPGCAQFVPFYRGGLERLVDEYPLIREVLGETNGLILYQEQVMEIARVLADFDDAEQDDVKESIKYFNHDNWENSIVPKFTARCAAKGVDATHILEAIANMASYTYNKAHAMSYAAIAYKMMWYKIKHPAVYYAGVFDQAGDKARLILESHFFNVNWHPADVNTSESWTTVRDGEIYLGLSAIKGVGPAAFEAIKLARPYSSLDDIMTRVNRRKCNARVITAMKEAFALTSIGEAGTPAVFEEAFGFGMRLLNAELSGELAEWQQVSHTVRLGGFVTKVKSFNVRASGANHGREMARATIVNINGSKECVIFPEAWRRLRAIMFNSAPVKLIGSYQTSGDFIAESGDPA